MRREGSISSRRGVQAGSGEYDAAGRCRPLRNNRCQSNQRQFLLTFYQAEASAEVTAQAKSVLPSSYETNVGLCVVSHIIGRSSSVIDDDDLEQAIWGELSIGVGYVMCHVTTMNCDHNELPQRPSYVMWHIM
jgi:hypothetical protein